MNRASIALESKSRWNRKLQMTHAKTMIENLSPPAWGRLVVMLAALAGIGCDTLKPGAVNRPPAKTPVLMSLEAAPSITGAFAPVAPEPRNPVGSGSTTGGFPTAPGVFRVLPSGIPNGVPRGVIKVFFAAPRMLALKVSVEGRLLHEFADVPANIDPQVAGYFRVENVDASDIWQVTIRPPLSPIPRFGLTIQIATISLNPNHTSGFNHESVPLEIKLASKPHRLAVGYPKGFPSCSRVPDFPRLRAGLTVRAVDVGLTRVDVGCCHFPSQTVGVGGMPADPTPVALFPFPALTRYSLVLKLGGQTAQGNSIPGLATTQAGQLELCMNDDNMDDNGGAWGVDVRIDE